MDVTAVEKVKTTMSLMDKAVQEVIMQISQLGEIQQEEATKIDKYVTSSEASLSSAAEVLRQQVGRQFSLVADELMSQKEELEATKSELKELLDMAERGDLDHEEVGLLNLAGREMPEVQLPVFHLVKSHTKMKASDVGYLQIAEYLPQEFRLQLDRLGLCIVTTTQQFTDRVQNSVKFNVKNKASKLPVTFVKEDCGLADDRKSFRLAFSAVQHGEYVVSVLLYDQHILNSPLRFTVPADEGDGYGVDKNPVKISSLMENRASNKNSCPPPLDVMTGSGNRSSTTLTEVSQPVPCSPDYQMRPRNDQSQPKTDSRLYDGRGDVFMTGNGLESRNKTEIITCGGINKSQPIDRGIESRTDVLEKFEIEANNNSSQQLEPKKSEKPVPSESNNNCLLIDKPLQSTVLDKPLTPTILDKALKSTLLDKGLQSTVLDFVGLADSGKLLWVRKASVGAGPATEPGGRVLPTLNKPIGICLLQNKTIVVASTGEHQVKLFSPAGKLLGHVTPPERTFFRPSDLASLKSGQFVVRDNGRVQVFSSSGEHVRTLVQLQPRSDCSCYGLAEDGEGRLVTIQQASRGERGTDLLFFDTISGELVKKISMEDVIKDKKASKCRFLTFSKDKLYITDLGLDCVYTLDPRNGTAKVFGKSGTGPSCFSDPAGLVVDEVGNTVVADSKNHRLCLYTSQGKFHSEVRLSPEVRRPSGLLLDLPAKEIYVLNLHGKEAMVKYTLGK